MVKLMVENNMRIVLDDWIGNELKEFLLTQDGIKDVNIKDNGMFREILIKYNNNTTPLIIRKYVDLFQKTNYATMIGFDKELDVECALLDYTRHDLGCEYCYKDFVESLFNNKFIKSVWSDFDLNNLTFDVHFKIEYNKNYSEDKLIDYINKC